MKKLLFVFSVLLIWGTAQAQDEKEKTEDSEGKNLVKLNLFALPLKNISIQYERAVARKVTVGGTVRLMPNGSIPFKNTFIKLADDPETEKQINNLKVGNFAVMPEVRYYLGKKGVYRGFYFSAFGNIARYSTNVLIEYDNNGSKETIPMKGNLTGITGGIMMGAQFKLSKSIYLDWWILGPNFGSSKGTLTGTKTMDAAEQQDLRDELDGLDIPLTKFTYTVNGSGATMNFKGPWAGVRSGLCIGVRF